MEKYVSNSLFAQIPASELMGLKYVKDKYWKEVTYLVVFWCI